MTKDEVVNQFLLLLEDLDEIKSRLTKNEEALRHLETTLGEMQLVMSGRQKEKKRDG